jgi:hypothetical protein
MNKLRHYFTIQACNKVFWHESYGILRSVERLTSTDKHGLTPLLVFGAYVEGVPLFSNQYTLQNKPSSITTFLTNFWSVEYSSPELKHLSGIPNVLVVDKRLHKVLGPEFFAWLEALNIYYEWSNGKDKAFAAKVRRCQEYPHLWEDGDDEDIGALSLNTLNNNILKGNYNWATITDKHHREFSHRLLHRQVSLYDSPVETEIAFDAESDKLFVISNSDVDCESLNIVTPKGQYSYLEVTSSLGEYQEKQQRLVLNIASPFVKCHPVGPTEISKKMGVPLPQLQKFLSGKQFLSTSQFTLLLDAIDIEMSERYEGYEMNASWSIHWCQKVSRKCVIELYNERSDGGDLYYSHEILPDGLGADPSFRMLLTITCSYKYSLLIFERGSLPAQVLDHGGEMLCNFKGPAYVDVKLYNNFLKLSLQSRTSFDKYQESLDKLQKLESAFEHAFDTW